MASSPNYGRQRSGEEITTTILNIANTDEGATKMRIMADVFITYESATGYLEMLMREGLIEYHPDTKTFSTTEEGKKRLSRVSG